MSELDTMSSTSLADSALLTPFSSPEYETSGTTEYNLKQFASVFSEGMLNGVVDRACSGLKNFLGSPTASSMLPSCISKLPNGTETGTCLVVDLGGSTLRVAFIKLVGNKKKGEILIKKEFAVLDPTKQLSGDGFFLWMAERVHQCLSIAIDRNIISADYEQLQMGLSWSFPFSQTKINRGVIQDMGKGYNVGVEIIGWELNEAFGKAFSKLGLRIRVGAVVNDGSASMISLAYLNPETRISLILGTGINAGVMFPKALVSPVKLAKVELDDDASVCMVNTEISMVQSDVVPETCWDSELDAHVERPGFQPLETKVSGRYLGEIARLIIRDLVKYSNLCDGRMPLGFETSYGFESSLMSELESLYYVNKMAEARQRFLSVHPCDHLTEVDFAQMCNIFIMVSTRSAALTAAIVSSLASLLPKEDSKEILIAFTGTVIEKYPFFQKRCQDFLDLLSLPRGMHLKLEYSEDGSLLGPAIAAAMYQDSTA